METVIKIDDDYTIFADNVCVTLKFSKVVGVNKETGKEIVSTRSTYHGNIRQALKEYMHQSIVDSRPSSIEQILSEIKRIENKIDEVWKL